jgi:YgiT-type zinc finger domain-containing protein
MSTAAPPQFVCPHCQLGSLHAKRIVFAHWFEGQFITIPNFPAWVCDICGWREYDAAALEQLETVLGPEADLRREAQRAARQRRRSPTSPLSPHGRRKA